jgi:hypothetical protein
MRPAKKNTLVNGRWFILPCNKAQINATCICFNAASLCTHLQQVASYIRCHTKLVVLGALTDSTLSETAGARLVNRRWLWLLVVVVDLPTGPRRSQ